MLARARVQLSAPSYVCSAAGCLGCVGLWDVGMSSTGLLCVGLWSVCGAAAGGLWCAGSCAWCACPWYAAVWVRGRRLRGVGLMGVGLHVWGFGVWRSCTGYIGGGDGGEQQKLKVTFWPRGIDF